MHPKHCCKLSILSCIKNFLVHEGCLLTCFLKLFAFLVSTTKHRNKSQQHLKRAKMKIPPPKKNSYHAHDIRIINSPQSKMHQVRSDKCVCANKSGSGWAHPKMDRIRHVKKNPWTPPLSYSPMDLDGRLKWIVADRGGWNAGVNNTPLSNPMVSRIEDVLVVAHRALLGSHKPLHQLV